MFYKNRSMWLLIKLNGVILTETLHCQSFGAKYYQLLLCLITLFQLLLHIIERAWKVTNGE